MQNSTEHTYTILGAPHVLLSASARVMATMAMEAMDAREASGYDEFQADVLLALLDYPDTDEFYHITKVVAERFLREHGTDQDLSKCDDVGILHSMGRLENRIPCRFPGWMEKALRLLGMEDDEFTMRIVGTLSRNWEYRSARPEEAERLRQRELDHLRSRHGEDSFATFWPLMNTASSHFEDDDIAGATSYLWSAARVWGDNNTIRIADLSELHLNLCDFWNCCDRNLNDAVEALLERVIQTMIPVLEADASKQAGHLLQELAELAADDEDRNRLQAAGDRILDENAVLAAR
jgi:hypothetical protein